VLPTAIDPRVLLPPPLRSTQIGVGTAFAIVTLFSEGVVKGRIDLSRFVAVLRPTTPSG